VADATPRVATLQGRGGGARQQNGVHGLGAVGPRRQLNLIKHADGRLTHIHIRARDLTKLTDFDEYRIRQTALDTIVLELGRRGKLTEDQHDSLVELVRSHAGADFVVDVRAVEEIDWGPSVKRLGFRNELM
jgi:phenylacetate-CoA ligase